MRVLNETDIKKYLRGFAQSNQRLGDHLIAALFGPLKNEADYLQPVGSVDPRWRPGLQAQFAVRAEPWLHFVAPDSAAGKIRHIADWIRLAMINAEPWLMETDDHKRPLKLLRIRSLSEAIAMANEALLSGDAEMAAAQIPWVGRDEEKEGHIEPVMDLGDGYRIVRLKTVTALDRETAFLGHCIGKGSYDDRVGTKEWEYYSLRDPYNKPHATFDVYTETNTLYQCKGAQNLPPVEEYFPYVQRFVKARDFELEENAGWTGLLKKDGIYYDVFNLPEGFEYRKDLVIPNTKRPLRLPEGLIINGWMLNLNDHPNLAVLPDNLYVNGSMEIKNCIALTTLPAGLHVGGTLKASGCTNLREILCKRIFLGGTLDLSGCSRLEILPDDVTVGYGMVLKNCASLTRLPAKLSAGDLDIRGCTGLRSLPEDLQVRSCIFTDFGTFKTVEGARKAFAKRYGEHPSPAPSPVV